MPFSQSGNRAYAQRVFGCSMLLHPESPATLDIFRIASAAVRCPLPRAGSDSNFPRRSVPVSAQQHDIKRSQNVESRACENQMRQRINKGGGTPQKSSTSTFHRRESMP